MPEGGVPEIKWKWLINTMVISPKNWMFVFLGSNGKWRRKIYSFGTGTISLFCVTLQSWSRPETARYCQSMKIMNQY